MLGPSLTSHSNSLSQDSFREFDVDGNGIVPVEEFVEKVMEKLNLFSEDSRTIEENATNLMPSGNKTVNEMILLMKPEKQRKSDNKIVAFIHIIEVCLGQAGLKSEGKSSEHSYMLTKDIPRKDPGSVLLRGIIRAAMKNSILELYRRFHFKRKFCSYLMDHPSVPAQSVRVDRKVDKVTCNCAIKSSLCNTQSDQVGQHGSFDDVADDLYFLASKPRCKWRRLRKVFSHRKEMIDTGHLRTSLRSVTSKSNSMLIPNAPNDEFDLSQLYILHHGLHVIRKVLRDFNIIADSSGGIPVLSQVSIPKTTIKMQNHETDEGLFISEQFLCHIVALNISSISLSFRHIHLSL